ncbi:uncharacterized protein LOC135166931 [Diachasmimorpha longicaudata]|uniref:uncharacterized protein LOC135166931 n=1 Tax=Diachasmimorpha longicaudata TaxID=58733 RepID=UPI0030B882A0
MNLLLFAAVTAVALHQMSACEFRTGSLYSPGDRFHEKQDKKAKTWSIELEEDLSELQLKMTYNDGRVWTNNKINGVLLCDEDENAEPFKKMLYTSIGIDSCDFPQGKYEADEVNEYPDDVCSKVSEVTEENDSVIYLTVMKDDDELLHVRVHKE